jgi:hypothetical protein
MLVKEFEKLSMRNTMIPLEDEVGLSVAGSIRSITVWRPDENITSKIIAAT